GPPRRFREWSWNPARAWPSPATRRRSLWLFALSYSHSISGLCTYILVAPYYVGREESSPNNGELSGMVLRGLDPREGGVRLQAPCSVHARGYLSPGPQRHTRASARMPP